MAEYTIFEPIWEGQTVAVLASGPSMTREVAEIVRKSKIKTIAVSNQAIRTNGLEAMAPWADVLYSADANWWLNNKSAVKEFKGLRVMICPNNNVFPTRHVTDLHVVPNGGNAGLDTRKGYIRTGHNSGYQAVALAVVFGAKRIVLCGFDMHGKNGQHWFGHHAWRPGYQSRFELFVRAFEAAAGAFKARGIEVINATPGSALTCFPFLPLEEAIYGVRNVSKSSEQAAAIGEEAARRDRAQAGATEVSAANGAAG